MARISGLLPLAHISSMPGSASRPALAPVGLHAHPIALIAQTLTHLSRTVVDELRQRKAMRELRGLDDRMLADIGLRPGEIETAARLGRHGLASHPQRI